MHQSSRAQGDAACRKRAPRSSEAARRRSTRVTRGSFENLLDSGQHRCVRHVVWPDPEMEVAVEVLRRRNSSSGGKLGIEARAVLHPMQGALDREEQLPEEVYHRADVMIGDTGISEAIAPSVPTFFVVGLFPNSMAAPVSSSLCGAKRFASPG